MGVYWYLHLLDIVQVTAVLKKNMLASTGLYHIVDTDKVDFLLFSPPDLSVTYT